jgi:hypothetical protein
MDADQRVELLREEGVCDVRRPARLGEPDAHGHTWYCFSCNGCAKDHKSFDSGRAMLDHLRDEHCVDVRPPPEVWGDCEDYCSY